MDVHVRIQAVLFDLDNTLTHRDLSVQAYAAHLSQVYAAHLESAQTQQMIDIIRRIDNGGYPKKEYLTHTSIAASVAAALLKELNWLNTPSLEELTEFWFERFGACAVAMPNMRLVLARLVKEGYRLAIISNGSQQTRMNIIEGLGIRDYFEAIVSSGHVGISKPKPEIFDHALTALQLRPEQCVYVGDHPVNDIQGAQNAGLHAVWLQGFHALKEPIQLKIQDLTALFSILEQLNTSA